MRALFVLLLPAAALAQQPPLERAPAGEPRQNQRIERIVIEDGGNVLSELRVGGATQSVTVQPKGPGAAYEIPGEDLARDRPTERREGGRQRVWNLLNF